MLIWITLYILATVLAYLIIRYWHKDAGISPGLTDVLLVFVPIVNIIAIVGFLSLIASENQSAWIGKFFMMK